jgi:hypothetical protein
LYGPNPLSHSPRSAACPLERLPHSKIDMKYAMRAPKPPGKRRMVLLCCAAIATRRVVVESRVVGRRGDWR